MKLIGISARTYYRITKITQNKEWDFLYKKNPNDPFANLNKNVKVLVITILMGIAFVVISVVFLYAFRNSLNGKNRRAKDEECFFNLFLVLIVLFCVVGIITLLTL